jgi:hypothetical protein
MNLKHTAIIAGVVALAAPTLAQASDQSAVHFQTGAFTIDQTTCKFLHREVDQPLGRTWLQGRIAFAYEDGRHDALDSCLRRNLNKLQNQTPPTAPPPSVDKCWTEAGEVPRNSGIELRNYLDKLQDCETGEVEANNQ